MIGTMYKIKNRQRLDDDYILMVDLAQVVCLMNARTNDLHWVTKHILQLEYEARS